MTPHVPPHAGDLIVAAVVAILVGGAGAIATVVLTRSLQKSGIHTSSEALRTRAMVLGVVLGIGTYVTVLQTRAMDQWFNGYFSFKTPEERFQEHLARFEEQVSRDPDIRRELEGYPDVSSRLMVLRRQGVARLDDSTLRQRARIEATLMSRLGDHACATIAGGRAPGGNDEAELQRAMIRLESAYVAEWMEVLHKCMLAAARKLPLRTVTAEEALAAYRALEAMIGVEEAQRVENGLKTGAPDAERCWAVRTAYEAALRLPEPHGTVTLILLARTE